MLFCFSNTFGFLVIDYVKVLKQLCWEIAIHWGIKSFNKVYSVPLFMAQLTKETGFSYQKLDIYGKIENWSEVLLNWNINIQFLNRKSGLVLINLYF